MSRLSFFLKRLSRMDWQGMWKTARGLAPKTDKSLPALLMDMLKCGLRYNAGYVDYKIARMDRLNDSQRLTVITRGISNNLVRELNDKAYWSLFDDKARFDELFFQYIKRGFMRVDRDTAFEPFMDFIKGKESVFVKPLEGSSGQGIFKALKADLAEPEALLKRIKAEGPSIVEETVIQHEKMAGLNPSSVNTVRIATLLGDKREGIVYAFLRIGNGKVMDNVDCGGMAARVDLDTGILKTVAADKQGNAYEEHPATHTPIIGFQVPYFEEAKALCLEAMRVVPQLRYVAWDVAITPEGPRLIEGNSFPSHAVPQFAAHYPDGIGILPEFEKFITIKR